MPKIALMLFFVSPTVAGCGTVSNGPGSGGEERDCDPAKPFGPPTVTPNINSSVGDANAFLADDLTIYWASQRAGGAGSYDLYLATRASQASSFANPTPITGVNTSGTEQALSLSGDGLMMYYAFAAVAGANGDVYATKRVDVASVFSVGTAVAQINLASDDGDPFVTADSASLYFASNRAGGAGSYDMYVALRRSDGSFDLPQLVSELNTAELDGHPVLTADSLTIYWASTRTDGGAQGGADIWTATRFSVREQFGSPIRVSELNSDYGDAPTWIAPDGCRIYLQTDRPGGLGASDIWEATKPM